MSKIGIRRYRKLLTIYNKINSLKDDFDGDRNVILDYDFVSMYFKLDCISNALKSIIHKC